MSLVKFSYRLLILSFIVSLPVSVRGQNAQEKQETTLKQGERKEVPTNCEDSLRLLDAAIRNVKQLPEGDLIVIVRLGARETSRKLIQSRTRLIEQYLAEARKTPHVIAEGKRTAGLGRIELYVQGKLQSTLYLERNSKNMCPTPIG